MVGDRCEVAVDLRAACVYVDYEHVRGLAGVRVPSPLPCLPQHPPHVDVQGNMLDFRATLCKFPPKPPTLSKPPTPWICPGPTVAMSIEAVASSMMKMLVFLTKARARQNSCLWPWLKFSPPSVMMASEISPRRGAGLSESWVVSRVDSVAWGAGAQKCLSVQEQICECVW